MQTFNFPYHVQNTEYPESGTRVQLGNGYIFTSPPNGPDLRRFTLKFETMKYFISSEVTSTNFVPNSVGVGAVAGTPGTLPAGWEVQGAPNTFFSVIGNGIDESGEPYVDVRMYGTNNSGGFIFPGWAFTPTTTAPSAANGQKWTTSVGVKLIGGSITGLTGGGLYTYIVELTAAGVFVTNENSLFVPTTTQNRFTQTKQLNGGATVARVNNSILATVANGAQFDISIRISLPQIEQSPVATSPIWTTKGAVTRELGKISPSVSPRINMAALEKFYQYHKLHRSFIYPHPVYGNTEVKFYSPLKIPEGIVGGDGALKDFSVELIEIIQ